MRQREMLSHVRRLLIHLCSVIMLILSYFHGNIRSAIAYTFRLCLIFSVVTVPIGTVLFHVSIAAGRQPQVPPPPPHKCWGGEGGTRDERKMYSKV